MRAFWAIELSEEARERLAAAQERLRGAPGGDAVRWTPAAGLHLTLSFLGDVADDRTDELAAAARGALPPGPLRLELAGLGSFGGARPRVVWAGVEGPDLQELVGLADRLQRAMRRLGFPGDRRPYSPHVTLGRVRAPHGGGRGRPKKQQRGGDDPRGLRDALRAASLARAPFEVGELVLFSSSHGVASGPSVYSAEVRLPFGPDARPEVAGARAVGAPRGQEVVATPTGAPRAPGVEDEARAALADAQRALTRTWGAGAPDEALAALAAHTGVPALALGPAGIELLRGLALSLALAEREAPPARATRGPLLAAARAGWSLGLRVPPTLDALLPALPGVTSPAARARLERALPARWRQVGEGLAAARALLEEAALDGADALSAAQEATWRATHGLPREWLAELARARGLSVERAARAHDPTAHDSAAHDSAAHDSAAHDSAAHDSAAHDPAAHDLARVRAPAPPALDARALDDLIAHLAPGARLLDAGWAPAALRLVIAADAPLAAAALEDALLAAGLPTRLLHDRATGAGRRELSLALGPAALGAGREDRARLDRLAVALRCAPDELEARVAGLRAERTELERERDALAAVAAGGQDLSAGESVGGLRFLGLVLPAGPPTLLRSLADGLRARPDSRPDPVAGLFLGPHRGRLQVVAALGPAAVARGLHARELLRAALAPLGGQGGGRRPDHAEGSAPAAGEPRRALAAARAWLTDPPRA
ncbi:MAG: RNA 2',3'-cyclic phosphodiesterase [Planctomycetota bacterium]